MNFSKSFKSFDRIVNFTPTMLRCIVMVASFFLDKLVSWPHPLVSVGGHQLLVGATHKHGSCPI